jgi:hypothetical protein
LEQVRKLDSELLIGALEFRFGIYFDPARIVYDRKQQVANFRWLQLLLSFRSQLGKLVP